MMQPMHHNRLKRNANAKMVMEIIKAIVFMLIQMQLSVINTEMDNVQMNVLMVLLHVSVTTMKVILVMIIHVQK